jgi:hypothetical protein
MMSVTITDEAVHISLESWDKVWALKGGLEIALAQVQAVRVSPPGLNPKGLRAPGTSWPGGIYAGTWRGRGYKEFWNVRRNKANWVEIELAGNEFARVVLEVDDPHALADQIEQARTHGAVSR